MPILRPVSHVLRGVAFAAVITTAGCGTADLPDLAPPEQANAPFPNLKPIPEQLAENEAAETSEEIDRALRARATTLRARANGLRAQNGG